MSPPSLKEILHNDLEDQSKQEGGNKMQAAKTGGCQSAEWVKKANICIQVSKKKKKKMPHIDDFKDRKKKRSVEAHGLLITFFGLFICGSLENPLTNVITETMRQSRTSGRCDLLWRKSASPEKRRLWSLCSVFLITASIMGAHFALMDGVNFIFATWGES